MIPNQIDRDIIRSGALDETEMDIDGSSKAHVFNILRNYTYNDKIGSPFREYMVNALDEHTKANIADKPFEVIFPSSFSPELRIRDYGVGLYPAVYSETCVKKVPKINGNEIVTVPCGGKVVVENWKGACEVCGESKKNLIGGVRKFFGDYGASDKRTTNSLVGAFGIGCKSAFAYTDSFTVVSIKDGKKWTFNLYIDETEVGKLVMLTEANTDEPNGVEVIIPVKPFDISTFTSRGIGLMKYFKTKPVVKGLSYVPNFERPEAAVSGEGWRYFGNNSGTVVIQGQIGYPVDISKVGQVSLAKDGDALLPNQIYAWENELLKSGLEIEVSIGDVDVTASREQLQMTPKTIALIRKRLNGIREEIVAQVSKKFVTASNLIEAKTAYYNFFQKGGSYGSTLAKSIGKIRWNNMDITDSTIILDSSKHKVIQYKKHYNGDIKQVTFEKIQCSDELNLFFDDTDRKMVNYRRRANTLLNAGAKSVTILQTDDVKALKAETLIDVKDLPKYSTVTPTVLASTRAAGSGIDVTKRIKHKLKVFELDWKKFTERQSVRGAKSDYWKSAADLEVDKQIYVPINRFEPDGFFQNDLRTLFNHLQDLNLLGIDIANTKIYGVKAGQDTGDMVRLDEWALAQVKKIPRLADEVALIKDYQTRKLFEFKLDYTLFPVNSLARRYAKEYANVERIMENSSYYSGTAKVRARLNLAEMAKLELPNVGKLVALSDEFKESYPLVRIISTSYHGSYKNDIVEYVTLLDEARDAKVGLLATASAA